MIEEKILSYLKKKKLDGYEILKKTIKKTSLEVKNGIIEDFKKSEEIQISLRILKNFKLGFSYFTGFRINEKDIENIIEKAINFTQLLPEDKYYTFTEDNNEENFDWQNKDISEISNEKLLEYANIIEQSAYDYDKRIKTVKNAGVSKGEAEIIFINSFGSKKVFKGNFIGAQVIAVSEHNNESYMGFESFVSKKLDLNPEKIGKNAGKKAVRMFGAKKGKSFKGKVIFENEVVADLLSIIAPSFFLENIEKKKSLFFKNQSSDIIANEKITLIDNGKLKELNGSVAFDDEGVNTTKKFLIKNGILETFLNNLYYANKYGTKPTGNGFKQSLKTLPSISTTNLILVNGKNSPEYGIKSINKGIYITNLMGLHMANTISGDFSLGAEGILIESGEFSYPVKEIVITGNIKEILLNTSEIYNDTKPVGAIYAPSILVEGIKISG